MFGGIRLNSLWGQPLPQSFYEKDTEDLAYALLGVVLAHQTPEGLTAGRIVEVEMYRGSLDRAAHSYSGVATKRTRVMFGPPGHAYVYFIYGMHYCLNVVSAPEGKGEAILVRALEPLVGLDIMARRRNMALFNPSFSKDSQRLTNGPAKLAQALGINSRQYGWPLFESPLSLHQIEDPVSKTKIARGPRINVSYAKEAADFDWRFWIRDNPFVSRG